MTLHALINQFKLNQLTQQPIHQKEISYGFCCDLMSDALMIMHQTSDEIIDQTILITGLVTMQSIRTAEMLDIDVVVIVRGKIPSIKVIELAERLNILILQTTLTMFSLSGQLYQKGIEGISYEEQW